MPRLPRVTGAEVVRALRRAGWYVDRQRGSHAQMRHPTLPGRATVPLHAGETLSPRVLATILEQAGMTADELRTLL